MPRRGRERRNNRTAGSRAGSLAAPPEGALQMPSFIELEYYGRVFAGPLGGVDLNHRRPLRTERCRSVPLCNSSGLSASMTNFFLENDRGWLAGERDRALYGSARSRRRSRWSYRHPVSRQSMKPEARLPIIRQISRLIVFIPKRAPIIGPENGTSQDDVITGSALKLAREASKMLLLSFPTLISPFSSGGHYRGHGQQKA